MKSNDIDIRLRSNDIDIRFKIIQQCKKISLTKKMKISIETT